AAGMIAEGGKDLARFRFSHDLTRETLYDDLEYARRIELHGKIGEALEEIHAENLRPYLAALAHHFRRGGGVGGRQKAIDYSIRAGDAAAAVFAFEDAALHWQAALELMQQTGARTRQRAELLERLASPSMYSG